MSRMRDAILAAAVGHVYKKEPDMFCRAYYFSSEFIGFAGHFPGNPVLPAIVQLMMAKILIEEYEEQPLKLSKVSRAKFIMPLQPEQEIIICCKKADDKTFLYDIMLYQSDKLAASFRLSLVTRGQVLK